MAIETRAEIESRIRNQVRGNFRKEAPADGLHQFVVTSAQLIEQPSKGDRDGNGAGCRSVAMRVAPLKEAGDISTVQANFETTVWLTLPTVNPDIDDHKVDPTTTGKFTGQASALVPDKVPHVSAKLPSGEWDNSPETKAARQRAQVEATLFAYEVLDNASILEDLTFYATSKKAAEGKEGYYVNGMHPELKPGERLVELTTAN